MSLNRPFHFLGQLYCSGVTDQTGLLPMVKGVHIAIITDNHLVHHIFSLLPPFAQCTAAALPSIIVVVVGRLLPLHWSPARRTH